jgi:hypothetical protein
MLTVLDDSMDSWGTLEMEGAEITADLAPPSLEPARFTYNTSGEISPPTPTSWLSPGVYP